MIESESCARRASSASDAGFRFRVLSFGLRMPSPPALSHPMGEGDRSGTCVTRPSNFMKRLRSLRPVAGHSSLEIRPKNEKKCGKRPPWPFQPQRNVIEMSPMRESESVSEWVSGSERSARCSAAVPGCEFRHRPGACSSFRAGLAARRRPNPQAGTPALRKNCKTNPCARRAGSKFQVQGSKPTGGHRPPLQRIPSPCPLPSDGRGSRNAAWGTRPTALGAPRQQNPNQKRLRLIKLI